MLVKSSVSFHIGRVWDFHGARLETVEEELSKFVLSFV